jgi:hypothetical protein
MVRDNGGKCSDASMRDFIDGVLAGEAALVQLYFSKYHKKHNALGGSFRAFTGRYTPPFANKLLMKTSELIL